MTTGTARGMTTRSLPGVLRTVRRPLRAAPRILRIGALILAVVVVASVIGRSVLPDPNEQDLLNVLAAPSPSHPFGTDELGRDVLSRTLAAIWLDLGFGIGAAFLSVAIGVTVGSAAGFAGGMVERIVMRFVDAVIAFPLLVFVLAVVAMLGPGIKSLLIAIVSYSWALYARFARGEMLVLREKQFFQATQTLGYSKRRVVLRHAIPNLMRPVAVFAASDIVLDVLAIATLSFLGLGVAPPTPEWGAIIASGQQYVLTAWWISTLPGAFVVVVGLGFVLIGDALGELLGVHRVALVQ